MRENERKNRKENESKKEGTDKERNEERVTEQNREQMCSSTIKRRKRITTLITSLDKIFFLSLIYTFQRGSKQLDDEIMNDICS